MSADISDLDKLIRKLRKKLRQIERLEFLGRPLNEEEIAKVRQKENIRSELRNRLEVAGSDSNGPQIPDLPTPVESTPKPTMSPNCESIVENGIEQMETSENDLTESTPENDTNDTPACPEVEATELALDRGEPMETTENANSSNQPEIEAQRPSEPAKVPVRPTKRSSPTCESTASSKTTDRKRKKCEPSENVQKLWIDETQLVAINLEAHNDLVCCVDIDSKYIISGSRDTLVQVWDADTGNPFQSLRGHSNGITCVSLLSATESRDLMALVNENGCSNDTGPRLALSAAMDCCFKLWNIIDGTMLSSVYTYSGITAMCYFPSNHACIIGSEGGKLEVYSFFTDEQPNPLVSLRAFDGPVSKIELRNDNIICCSLDGFISVFTLKNNENQLELVRLFHSERLVSESGQTVSTRPVLSLALPGSPATNGPICYGDEGANIKILNWKEGQVKKLRNHIHEFGLTNAICATESLLLSSSLDVDTGCSTINVRSLPQLNYEGTLDVSGIERIVCLAATETSNGSLKLVVGGSKLTLLESRAEPSRRSPKKSKCIRPVCKKELALPAQDSGDESICSSSEDESETEMPDDDQLVEESEPKSTSWCNLL